LVDPSICLRNNSAMRRDFSLEEVHSLVERQVACWGCILVGSLVDNLVDCWGLLDNLVDRQVDWLDILVDCWRLLDSLVDCWCLLDNLVDCWGCILVDSLVDKVEDKVEEQRWVRQRLE